MIHSKLLTQLVGGGNGIGNIAEPVLYSQFQWLPLGKEGGDGTGKGAAGAVGGDAFGARVTPAQGGFAGLYQNVGAGAAAHVPALGQDGAVVAGTELVGGGFQFLDGGDWSGASQLGEFIAIRREQCGARLTVWFRSLLSLLGEPT